MPSPVTSDIRASLKTSGRAGCSIGRAPGGPQGGGAMLRDFAAVLGRLDGGTTS